MHRLMIFTPQPAVLADFYCRLFGLQVGHRETGFVDVAGTSGVRLAFHQGKSAPSRALKLCFYAADVAAEHARLIEQGVPMGQLKGNADALWFCDGQAPDGNCLQISNRA
ncbi:VOC family protein [Aquipseudomonas alcaligenes]|uniref:VOC family protein n=1 Tax=Aquipseudomonas alcaligenes TaxID=43263 RepID=A0AB73HWX6_AQUAC|nr:VOC family protein [Pseudomonas alcaligenes]MDH0141068.1 VOC family protein [Pseudomonas alcaligenes]